jgi:[ribosomal protein S5]-alanine N-acetyltransferase
MFKAKIILKPLVRADADFLYSMYTNPAIAANYKEPPFSDGESADSFATRLISVCEAIFTIRLVDSPDIAIGDCALHHWNPDTKEIEIGGCLMPAYWGKGLMKEAFELLSVLARTKFDAHSLIGNTELTNLKAARLVEKMGFKRDRIEGENLLFRKML